MRWEDWGEQRSAPPMLTKTEQRSASGASIDMGGREPVIAIDGPAGAGKGTVARRLAARLGYRLLDTGAMYRALAWSVARAGLAPDDTPALRRHVERVQIDFDGDRVVIDERDVTEDIRTPEIAALTSR